jgi:hypothetical protein
VPDTACDVPPKMLPEVSVGPVVTVYHRRPLSSSVSTVPVAVVAPVVVPVVDERTGAIVSTVELLTGVVWNVGISTPPSCNPVPGCV